MGPDLRSAGNEQVIRHRSLRRIWPTTGDGGDERHQSCLNINQSGVAFNGLRAKEGRNF